MGRGNAADRRPGGGGGLGNPGHLRGSLYSGNYAEEGPCPNRWRRLCVPSANPSSVSSWSISLWQASARGLTPEISALFVDASGPPAPLTRAGWSLPDHLLQGLGRLAFWLRLASKELAHLGREESQQQLNEVSLSLSSALEALAPLWGDGEPGSLPGDAARTDA